MGGEACIQNSICRNGFVFDAAFPAALCFFDNDSLINQLIDRVDTVNHSFCGFIAGFLCLPQNTDVFVCNSRTRPVFSQGANACSINACHGLSRFHVYFTLRPFKFANEIWPSNCNRPTTMPADTPCALANC